MTRRPRTTRTIRTSRSVRAAAALVAVVLLAGACSSDGRGAEQDAGGAFGSSTPGAGEGAEPAPGADVDYVAMGDSYSAGPFVATMRDDPTGCARSNDNYPAFLADWLGVKSYTDVTCSAATTADLYDPMLMFDGNTTRPQLDAVTPDTDLVTLGMGGNDFGIYDGLIGCQAAGSTACPVDRLRADAAKVAGRVATAVRRIRAAASPEARVLVVGYPDIVPADGTCADLGVPASVLAPLVEVAATLNDSLRRGAERGGGDYIDMEAVSEGHDVCATGTEAWINGPQTLPGIAAPFHPKIEGMRAVATEVYRELTGTDPSDVTEYAEPDPDVVVANRG